MQLLASLQTAGVAVPRRLYPVLWIGETWSFRTDSGVCEWAVLRFCYCDSIMQQISIAIVPQWRHLLAAAVSALILRVRGDCRVPAHPEVQSEKLQVWIMNMPT